jgi:hypothetical protein
MGRRSAVNAVSVAIVCGGIGSLLAASAMGTRAANFDILIVVGVDALTIGAAIQILLRLFLGQHRGVGTVGTEPPARSLQKGDAHELKIALVQHLSRERPVFIGFPPHDREAHRFAQQIAAFLDNDGFRIGRFAVATPPVPFAPGVGIDGNRVMVGPFRAEAGPCCR